MKLAFYIVAVATIVAVVCSRPSKRDNDEELQCPSPEEGCCYESDLPIPDEHGHDYTPKKPIYAHGDTVIVGSYAYLCSNSNWEKIIGEF